MKNVESVNSKKIKQIFPFGKGLIIKNLRKSYKKKPILRDVNFKLKKGEAIALLGPNGTGKTTCFYSVVGLTDIDSGQIIIDDTIVTNFPMYRRARLGLGYLPQESSIFKGLSVEKNIMAVWEISVKDKQERKRELELF